MAGLFRILTAVVLAAHLMVGCCSHHAHACEGNGDVQPAHEPCHDSHDSGADHSPRTPLDCQVGQCTFVSSSNSSGHSLVQHSQAFALVLLTDKPSLPSAGAQQNFFASGRLLPSVRLYLVNQVLLI